MAGEEVEFTVTEPSTNLFELSYTYDRVGEFQYVDKLVRRPLARQWYGKDRTVNDGKIAVALAVERSHSDGKILRRPLIGGDVVFSSPDEETLALPDTGLTKEVFSYPNITFGLEDRFLLEGPLLRIGSGSTFAWKGWSIVEPSHVVLDGFQTDTIKGLDPERVQGLYRDDLSHLRTIWLPQMWPMGSTKFGDSPTVRRMDGPVGLGRHVFRTTTTELFGDLLLSETDNKWYYDPSSAIFKTVDDVTSDIAAQLLYWDDPAPLRIYIDNDGFEDIDAIVRFWDMYDNLISSHVVYTHDGQFSDVVAPAWPTIPDKAIRFTVDFIDSAGSSDGSNFWTAGYWVPAQVYPTAVRTDGAGYGRMYQCPATKATLPAVVLEVTPDNEHLT